MSMRSGHLPRIAAAAGLCAGLLTAAPGWPQAWPSRPVTVLSTTSIGAPGDVAIRLIAPKVSEALGQQFVIEPRLGAAGLVAGSLIAKAAPDGYTLIYGASGSFVMSRYLVKDISYDALKDFTPVATTVTAPQYLAVHESVPARNIRELIEFSKKNPGKLEYGTTGIGGSQHMIVESFLLYTGSSILHVPYSQKNAAQLQNDFLSGRLQVNVLGYNNIAPNIATGKFRVLVLIDDQRSRQMPEVPAIKEIFPSYHPIVTWWGVFAPPGTPRPVVTRLETEIRTAMKDPAAIAKLEPLGLSVIAGSGADLARTLAEDIESVGRLVKELGLKPQ